MHPVSAQQSRSSATRSRLPVIQAHLNTTPSKQGNSDSWAAVIYLLTIVGILFRTFYARGRWLRSSIHTLPPTGYSIAFLAVVAMFPYLVVKGLSVAPRGLTMVSYYSIFTLGALWLMRTELWLGFAVAAAAYFLRPNFSPTRLMMLQESCNISLQHKALFVLHGALNILVFLYGALTLFPFQMELLLDSSPQVILEFIVTGFVVIWSFQLSMVIVQSVTEGVSMRWYCDRMSQGPAANTHNNQLVFRSSLKRTFSIFGTCCMSSFVNSVTFVLHYLTRLGLASGKDDSFAVAIIKAILRIIVDMIKSIVDLFNRVAMSYSTLTAKSFYSGANASMKLLSSNDSLHAAIEATSGWETYITSVFMTLCLGGVMSIVAPAGISTIVASCVGLSTLSMAHATGTAFPNTLFLCMSQPPALAIGGNDYHSYGRDPNEIPEDTEYDLVAQLQRDAAEIRRNKVKKE
jgi:hypothetical protein